MAAARGGDTSGVQCVGNPGQGANATPLDSPNDRQHVPGPGSGICHHGGASDHSDLFDIGATQHVAPGFLACNASRVRFEINARSFSATAAWM